MDGLNGDTCNGVNISWWQKSVEIGHPLVLEPQSLTGGINMHPGNDGGFKNLAYDIASWGERWQEPHVPLVAAYKYIDTRHMTHITQRHATNRTNDLQTAWFNGCGYNPWESVWCMWNTLTPRDAHALKQLSAMYNEYGNVLQGTEFHPHVPVTRQDGVFASQFGNTTDVLWTLINKAGHSVEGGLVTVPCVDGTRFFDIYRGAVLDAACDGGVATLQLRLEQGGFGAVLRSTNPPRDDFMTQMREITERPLDMYSAEWRPVNQILADQPRTAALPRAKREGTVPIAATQYHFRTTGNQGGGGPIPDSEDVQMPWESHPQKSHDHVLDLTGFDIDVTPVTNEAYAAFIASGWTPAEPDNWVKHFDHSQGFPSPRAGDEKHPVTWVSRQDAIAYCRHQGKRLPETWEWQLAAQGTDGLRFPWGNTDCATCHPRHTGDRWMPPPEDVDAYPTGASPYGLLDLWGNTYEWTSEFTDAADPIHHGHTGHASRAILKGGSRWRPSFLMPPNFYFPQPTDLMAHNIFLVHSDAFDRSGNIGFRCAADH